MKQVYGIVYGSSAENTIKAHKGKYVSFKEANWMYQNIVYQPESSRSDVRDALFMDESVIPQVVLEGGNWVDARQFSPSTWPKTLESFLNMVAWPQEMSVYSFDIEES